MQIKRRIFYSLEYGHHNQQAAKISTAKHCHPLLLPKLAPQHSLQ
jgi:hypothetical protein